MRAMRITLLSACLLSCLAVGACGGSGDKANTKCLSDDPALEAAARKHVETIVVGIKAVGNAHKISVDTCRTSGKDATATVTVEGVHDAKVRDQRHQLTLHKNNSRWAIVRDLDTQRCRKGQGHQDFSSLVCK
jgi:hypothetical protein